MPFDVLALFPVMPERAVTLLTYFIIPLTSS